ncbi:CVNH domain-containing protein [Methylobacterium oryzisoli]
MLTCSHGGASAQPSGSYLRSCRNIRVDNDTLYASCRDKGGRYRDGSLGSVGSCAGEVFNDNGALRCSRGELPNGTYLRSCSRGRVEGDTLFARCNQIGSGARDASLADFKHCWSDISNVNGHLTCDQGDRPAPEGSYKQTCIQRMMSGVTLAARCMDSYRAFKTTSLDTSRCREPIQNRNGRLICGSVAQQPPPPPPAQGYSAVDVLNCQGSRRALVIWRSSAVNPNWVREGVASTSYQDNICPGTSTGLRVELADGANLIRALDTAVCGRDDPTIGNCIRGELNIIGRKGGPYVQYPFGP